MHSLILKLLTTLLALMLLGAAPSFANVDRPMAAHPDAKTLGAACGAAGGSFSEVTVEGYHSYGCTKDNCDGKGGTCSVNCGDKGCTGNTPTRIDSATLLMLLQNGSLVNHAYAADDVSATPNHPTGPAAPAGSPLPVFY